MNHYSAYPHRLPGGRYWAMIRVCRDAHPAPVMEEQDRPKVFETRGAAAEECLRHIVAFMNGRPIRGEKFDGGVISLNDVRRAKAEKLFLGGGRTVQVERA